jgi:glucose/arabinose dehydrogenase
VPAGAGQTGRLQLRRIAAGFAFPTHAAVAPGELGRLYVVERRGRVKVLDLRTRKRRTFLDLSRRVSTGGLRGLFSIAFHPGYGTNHRLFVAYSGRDGDLHVDEFRAKRRREVLRIPVDPGLQRHYGGQLAFGPDGLLYVGVGDGGIAGSKQASPAQDLSSLLGKLLRIDVDGLVSLTPEIAAYGLRNPWRFSFDRRTGDLYVADVGELRWEEVDFVPGGDRRLKNFGWDAFEARQPARTTQVNPAGELVYPLAAYGRRKPNCGVIGGHVFRGRYFYGDLCSGRIWSFRVLGARAVERRREPFVTEGALTSFAHGAKGELYVLSGGPGYGIVYRVTG